MSAGNASDDWRRLEELVASLPEAGMFSPDLVSGEGDAVARYFERSIAPGTALAPGARLAMRGRIKVGRWLPFRATQLLVPRVGTVWKARVAGLLGGSDRYVAGRGGMDWKLLGLVPVTHADGADVLRSTAERAAGESIWVPTAMVPSASTEWSVEGVGRIAVATSTDGHPVRLEHDVDSEGRIRSSHLERWGDPDETGRSGAHPFGIEVEGHRTFGPVTIPNRGRAGWHHRTDRWEEGVFIRFEISHYELLD